MKTFALVVYLFMNDGTSVSFFEDSGLTARDCVAALVEWHVEGVPPQPHKAFKGGRVITDAIISCEEEQEA